MLDLYIYKNGVLLTNVYYYDYMHEPQLYSESDYEAGDVFTFGVDYWYWFSPVPRDFTIKVYSS